MFNLLLIVHLWAVLLGKALRIEPPLPGYRVQDFQWEVPVSPDGRTAIMLNGTVQEVYKQLLRINPSYEEEVGGSLENRSANSQIPLPLEVQRDIWDDMKRHSWSECGRFDPARESAVWAGIDHLNHVSGRPVSMPGPGACGRVSCSYNSAIWWCNDMFTEKSLTSFNEIGSSVQLLTGNCAYWSDERLEPHISGQQSHDDKWKTIVREAAC